MKTINPYLIIFGLLFSTSSFAQQVGKIDVQMDGFTEKKFNHTEKRIYIQYFNVSYQMIMVSYAKAKGGGMGDYTYGDATAALALGLDGVTEEQLQAMTDKYYEDYVKQLEANGFEIVTPDEALKNEFFAGREKALGGTPRLDPISGYLITSPKAHTFLVGNASSGVMGGMTESKSMGGMIIARVGIIVPFAEAQNLNGGLVGGVAKVTAKADLRVSPAESIPQKGDFKKPLQYVSDITFAYKESLKWQAIHRGKLKSPIEVEGVLDENKKYKSTSVATTGSGFSAKYSDAYSENVALVACDGDKYEKGVNQAISGYIKATLDGFFKFYK